MTSDAPDHMSFQGLLQTVGSFIVWVGGSVSAIGVLLTVFGYLVESAYLSTIGLPRGAFELTSTQYIASGGQFLIGIIPLAFAGALSFALEYWPILGALFTLLALGAWRRWGASYRWLTFAAVHTAWLAIIVPRLQAVVPGSEANRVVTMLTFSTVASLLYAYFEHYLGRTRAPAPALQLPTLRYLPQIPFFFVLFVALLTLPYARGTKGLVRSFPIVELPSRDAQVICQFALDIAASKPENCERQAWELIQIGKNQTVLRNLADKKIYVVPIAATTMFRILSRTEAP